MARSVEIPGFGFAVEVKRDCPHVEVLASKLTPPSVEEARGWLLAPCDKCGSCAENWVSVASKKVLCSRYVNEHMLIHWEQTKRAAAAAGTGGVDGIGTPEGEVPAVSATSSSAVNECVAISFSDLSVWCFECDSYIESPCLKTWLEPLRDAKFTTVRPSAPPAETAEPESTKPAAPKLSSWVPDDVASERKQRLLDELRAGKYSRIGVLAGAGLSVAAGIPDFRSSSGVYKNLASWGVDPSTLSGPEDVFSIDFFLENPVPFYATAAHLFGRSDIKPTRAHRFLALLHKKGLLRRVFTQNIDGLELEAGIPSERVVQCHGGMTSAHCANPSCREEVDIALVHDALKASQTSGAIVVPKCPTCGFHVKPDITFFGEDLPSRFGSVLRTDLSTAGAPASTGSGGCDDGPIDLLLIMGTSLKVAPVCIVPDLVAGSIPRVLMNLEPASDIGVYETDVELYGALEDVVKDMADSLGWADELLALS